MFRTATDYGIRRPRHLHYNHILWYRLFACVRRRVVAARYDDQGDRRYLIMIVGCGTVKRPFAEL